MSRTRADDCAAAPAQESDEQLFADSPAPPPSSARWRSVLFRKLHSRRAHLVLMTIIILDMLLNQAGVLLSLFTCGRKKSGAVRAAETALRWASVALLVIMLLELLARAAAVGVTRFFRSKVHSLDGADSSSPCVCSRNSRAGASDADAHRKHIEKIVETSAR